MTGDYHEGRPTLSVIGKGRQALVLVKCPYGHVYTTQPMQEWAGGWLEAKATDANWTVRCEGTLPR